MAVKNPKNALAEEISAQPIPIVSPRETRKPINAKSLIPRLNFSAIKFELELSLIEGNTSTFMSIDEAS